MLSLRVPRTLRPPWTHCLKLPNTLWPPWRYFDHFRRWIIHLRILPRTSPLRNRFVLRLPHHRRRLVEFTRHRRQELRWQVRQNCRMAVLFTTYDRKGIKYRHRHVLSLVPGWKSFRTQPERKKHHPTCQQAWTIPSFHLRAWINEEYPGRL